MGENIEAMKNHGLRGSQLEEMINLTIETYRKHNLALIQKIPTPITPMKIDSKKGQITLAYFEKKSTVDYIGVVQEIPVCFDAKECAENTFPISNIHEHQYKFMKDFDAQGGAAFLLILFKEEKKVYYMTFQELTKFWKRKKVSFNINELNEEYFMDVKNKIRCDFLPKLQLDIDSR